MWIPYFVTLMLPSHQFEYKGPDSHLQFAALVVKNLPIKVGLIHMGSNTLSVPVQIHSNPGQYFCLRILWTEEPGGLYSTEVNLFHYTEVD